jgi:hypothetical protein
LAQPVELARADQRREVGVAGGQHAVIEADTDRRAPGFVVVGNDLHWFAASGIAARRRLSRRLIGMSSARSSPI